MHRLVDGVRVDLSDEEIAQLNAKGEEWKKGAADRAWASIREERDRRLVVTDFYALSDVTMSADMTTYRQALRDLPATTSTGAAISGTPTADEVNEATWPTKP